MNTHYLRIEGVNLASFVFDTRDLSTTRGGSLLLLKAVRHVEGCLSRMSGCSSSKPVSVGASVGVFEIETTDANQVVTDLMEELRAHDTFKEATFVIDAVPKTVDFRKDLETLLAKNRWEQMQASSLAIPQKQDETAVPNHPACGLDGLRPAMNGHNGSHNVRGSKVSKSVWRRHTFGRASRQDFYEKLTGIAELNGKEFSTEFEHIAAGTAELDKKMAVFYADGNSFGSLQTVLCDSPAKQALWDHLVQSERKKFMTDFLRNEVLSGTKVNRAWLNASKNRIRFETLLWGGDELMFVMPAALGWRFATLFFKALEGKRVEVASLPAESPWASDNPKFTSDQVLTHTAALVFCHHHAPIHRIKALAKEQMADFAKAIEKDENGRKVKVGRSRDQMLVLALESFDHMGTSYESGINQRYHGKVSAENVVIHGNSGGNLSEVLGTISSGIAALKSAKSQFARSQLRWLVSSYLRGEPGSGHAIKLERVFDKKHGGAFRKATADDKSALGELKKLFPGSDAALWIQLEELWDYARP